MRLILRTGPMMGTDMRSLLLLFLLAAVALGCAESAAASPAVGLMRFSHNHGWEVYATSEKFHDKERLFVLSLDSDHSVICCALIEGAGRKSSREMFLSDANNDSGTQFIYLAHLPDVALSSDGKIAMVVSAKSVRAARDGYEVTNFDGRVYMVSSCFGAEGVNVYTHDSNRSGDHYYGYLGYAVENSNCSAR